MDNKDFVIETSNNLYNVKGLEALVKKVTALKAIGVTYRVIYLDKNDNPVVMQADL